MPYYISSDISLGNHTLTAVYTLGPDTRITDDKTLTIIQNIPEGAGDRGETPSSENEKQETYKKDTIPHKNTNSIQSNIPTMHQIIETTW